MKAGDDRVLFDNAEPLPVSQQREGADADRGHDAVCFFGDDTLPANIVRGRQYFVVESTPEFIRIAEPAGRHVDAVRERRGPQTRLISNLFQAHLALYAPTGSGPGKGALDLVGCEKVIVRGCRLSALGDTMHIQKSRGVVFADNHITGSRMGAFFLAEFCQDAIITGNTVDGYERLARGQRGEVVRGRDDCRQHLPQRRTRFMDQPAAQLRAGRQCLREQHDQVRTRPAARAAQFRDGRLRALRGAVLHHPRAGGRYGNVIVRGNIFTSGPHAEHAITFAPGGDTMLVADNIFSGPVRDIAPVVGCDNVTVRGNMESAGQ